MAAEVLLLQALGIPVHTAVADQVHPDTAEHDSLLANPGQPPGDLLQVPGPGIHPQWGAASHVSALVFTLHRVGIPSQRLPSADHEHPDRPVQSSSVEALSHRVADSASQ